MINTVTTTTDSNEGGGNDNDDDHNDDGDGGFSGGQANYVNDDEMQNDLIYDSEFILNQLEKN